MATSCFVLFTLAFFPTTRAVDLGKSVCQDMWNRAGNNLKIPLELGVASTGTSVPLFQVKKPEGTTKIGQPVFVKFDALLKSYFNNPSKTNLLASEFIEAITKTGGPIEIAFEYLRDNGYVDKTIYKNLGDFKVILQKAWFGTYMKKGSTKPHSGFEHVFLGDLVKTDFKGFHNWYQFLIEQQAGKISNVAYGTFQGSTQPAYMSGLTFTWRKAMKKAKAGSSMFVGTSPAFDIALFTVCFIALKRQDCNCNIGRSRITIKTFAANSPPDAIATAYPANVDMPAGRCNIAPDDDCGWVGIDQKHCEDRGCCWLPKGQTNWCFYPKDHKCHGISPSKRQECGYLGIQREECEITRDCCFDHSVPNVPFCFKGNP